MQEGIQHSNSTPTTSTTTRYCARDTAVNKVNMLPALNTYSELAKF